MGSAATLKSAAAFSRPRGKIILVGLLGGTVTLGWGLFASSCEFAISLRSTRQHLREVCELVKDGKVRVDLQRSGFHEIQKAYEELRDGSLVGRAVVVFTDPVES